jgi:hypothetical protein
LRYSASPAVSVSIPEVFHHHEAGIGRAVEDRDAAISQLGRRLGVHDHAQVGKVDALAQPFLDHVQVVGHPDRAPHVGHAIAVAGVVALDDTQDLGVKVGPAGQPGAVELLEHPRLDEAHHRHAGMQHHVIAGRSRQHLGLGFLGAGVKVVDHLDPGFGGKVGQRRLADVVGPVVDVHHPALRPGRAHPGRGKAAGQGGKGRSTGQFHGVSSAVGSRL